MKVKSAKLCVIGSEVLNGFIIDTNTHFFSEELFKLGIEVSESRIIRDNLDQIILCLKEFQNSKELIITCGGLGPTNDDLTVDALSLLLTRKSVIDEYCERKIKAVFKKRYSKSEYENIIEKALKQGRVIEGSMALKNKVGLAAGFFIKEIPLFSFPGFPDEIKSIWPQAVKIIKNISETRHAVETIPLWNVGESRLFSEIKIPQQLEVGVHALPLGSRLFIKAKNEEGFMVLQKFKKNMSEKYDGLTEEDPLKIFIEHCKKENKTFSFVESCSGGYLASIVTSYSGVSPVFKGAMITYDNAVKVDAAGVSEETLKKYGAVSLQTALEMAEGGLQKMNTDICLSITGIAGPSGGSKEKPVGLFFMAIAKKNNPSYVAKFHYPFGRKKFIEAAAYTAFLSLYQKEVYYKNDEIWLKKSFAEFTKG
ncbi:MAG: nicotinamide-nucleotide amidohydrolase family protein [Spirochaetia bacterium]|nr:nicotinamide-nucleotide amidohydrolase family protein [Spirochaetia bacterium]